MEPNIFTCFVHLLIWRDSCQFALLQLLLFKAGNMTHSKSAYHNCHLWNSIIYMFVVKNKEIFLHFQSVGSFLGLILYCPAVWVHLVCWEANVSFESQAVIIVNLLLLRVLQQQLPPGGAAAATIIVAVENICEMTLKPQLDYNRVQQLA